MIDNMVTNLIDELYTIDYDCLVLEVGKKPRFEWAETGEELKAFSWEDTIVSNTELIEDMEALKITLAPGKEYVYYHKLYAGPAAETMKVTCEINDLGEYLVRFQKTVLGIPVKASRGRELEAKTGMNYGSWMRMQLRKKI